MSLMTSYADNTPFGGRTVVVLPLLFLLLIILGTGSAKGQPQPWTSSSTSSPGFGMGTSFIDSLNGVVASWGFGASGMFGEIRRTTDGGKTWDVRFDAANTFMGGVAFAHSAKGNAIGNDPGCGCGGIYRTIDGGITWELQLSVPAAVPSLYGIDFIDTEVGFIGGDNGVLLKTTDGGATWNELDVNIEGIIRSIHFVDRSNGFLASAEPPSSLQGQYIYKTTDGGNSWTDISIPGFISEAVYFTSPLVGVVVGSSGNASVMKTTDGGMTWTQKYRGSDNNAILAAVQFTTPNTGYAVGGHLNFGSGQRGIIVATTDGGETWKEEKTDLPKTVRGLHFPTQYHGFVAGDAGMFLATRRTAQQGLTPEIAINMEEIDFPRLPVGETATRVLEISPMNSAGIVVNSVAFDHPSATTKGFSFTTSRPLPATLQQGEKLEVAVTFEAKGADIVVTTLAIRSNDLSNSEVIIPISGRSQPGLLPTIITSTDIVDFGEVAVQNSKDMQIRISGGTNAGLQVQQIEILYPGEPAQGLSFTTSTPLPVTLAGGNSLTVDLHFAPQTMGSLDAILIISTNDPMTPQKEVSIRGIAGAVASADSYGESTLPGLAINIEPNPVKDQAHITFTLPEPGHVLAELYTPDGKKALTLADAPMEAGDHLLQAETSNIAPGIYLCLLRFGNYQVTQKVMVVR